MDTDSNYKIIITPTAKSAAKRLMEKVENEVQKLKYAPKIHTEIEKYDELKRNYRRIVINNFIILYTIDENNMVVYISHMYYGGRDYTNNSLYSLYGKY